MTDDPRTLVSTAWLAERLGDPAVVVLDASWHLPGSPRDAAAEFLAGHVPGAGRFDLDALSGPGPLPHMAPPPARFEAWARAAGVGPDTQVVAYDGSGLFSAARAWWTFRHMGHDRVAVLDGGLPKWRAEGRPVEAGPARPRPAGPFKASPRPELVRDADGVARALADGSAAVLDARAAPRFRGEAPEPRPGLRPGHMPGALNLPFDLLLGPDGTLKSPEALAAAFAAAGLDAGRPAITTCGSGVTAAILSLALERLGRPHALYDGSWAEWGASTRPTALGA